MEVSKVRLSIDLVLGSASAKREYSKGDRGITSIEACEKFLKVSFERRGEPVIWAIPYEHVQWMEVTDAQRGSGSGDSAGASSSEQLHQAGVASVPEVRGGRGRPPHR